MKGPISPCLAAGGRPCSRVPHQNSNCESRRGRTSLRPRTGIELVDVHQREVIVFTKGRLGALALVRRVQSNKTIRVPVEIGSARKFIWDEGWAFYTVQGTHASRPQRVFIPPKWIPQGTHTCRVILVSAGTMNLRPTGWNRGFAIPSTASSEGLTLHVDAGWTLQLDLFGAKQRSLELRAQENDASISILD